MSDLVLAWNGESLTADLVLDAGQLLVDGGLKSAIIVSLFSDARAYDDDPLPEAGADRRGWWGDALALQEGDRFGSRLWLLHREKQTNATLERARTYGREALQWLVDDGIATAVDVTAEAPRPGYLALGVSVARPEGPSRDRFDFVWGDVQ